jgi:hypothetical protein
MGRDLGWRADGIERALAAGGVMLELYTRPGFTGGKAVRRVPDSAGPGAGFAVEADPEPEEYAPDQRATVKR